MLIKIKTDNPLFIQKIELLKLQYRTGANSKAAKAAIENFYEMDRKVEILEAQVESMQAEIDRLRELLNIVKDTTINTKLEHMRSLRKQKVY